MRSNNSPPTSVMMISMSAIFVLMAAAPQQSHAFSVLPMGIVQHHHQQPQLATLPSTMTSTVLFMGRGGGKRRYQPRVIVEKPPMNADIAADEMRVVTQNNDGKDEALGVMTKDEALSKARELGGLDLIMINANSSPPVCKIVDYSKYRYMQEKKAKEVKKNSKASEIKEVKMSYKIDVHDYGVRKKNASKFLSQGNRVKCTVMFRGREMQHDKLGFELLDKMANDLTKLSTKEGRAKREGRSLSLILSPRTEVLKAVNEGRKADDRAKKEKKEAQKIKKAAAAAAAAATTSVVATANPVSKDGRVKLTDEEEMSLEETLESSLGSLFGDDDLTDDLFN